MKKIHLFINSLSSGGAEHQIVELANGLADKGYSVTIVTFSDIADHYIYSPLVKRYKIAPGASNIMKMLGIWKYFLTLQTDWVISFGQRANRFCLMPLMFRNRKEVHVIAGERSLTRGEPTKDVKRLFNVLYRRADYIVPNSHAQRDIIIRLVPRYKEKTITITNYTDIYKYQASPLPSGNIIKIGIFGRYDASKNLMRFVDAVKKIKAQTKQEFIVEWYGNQWYKDTQPNPLYVEMKQKVEEYELQNVLFLNDQTKDVAGNLKKFDAFCLPSLWEGFSNAIGEAICCGRPCLVSNVADNSVMVQDELNGFLFDPQSTDDIVAAFLKFFSLTKDERSKMGKESRKRAETLFNKELFISSYEKLINDEFKYEK